MVKEIVKKLNSLINYKNIMYHKDLNQEVHLTLFNFLSKIKLLKMIEMNFLQNHQFISKKIIMNKYKILMKKLI